MSDMMGGLLPRFQSLDALIQKDASALVVTRDQGGLVADTSAGMALRSGTHRVFGAGKSEADMSTNRASLTALLDQIEGESSKFVRRHVEEGLIALGGDKDSRLTLMDRMRRGTYVSSDLVAQMKSLAIEGAKEEIRHHNETAAQEYLTRKRGDAFDWQNGLGRTVAQTGVEDLLEQLATDGTDKWSAADYPRAWKALQSYVAEKMERGVEPGDDPVLKGLKEKLAKAAEQASAKNVRLTPEMLGRIATEHLASLPIFSQFVRTVNLELAHDVMTDRRATADAIRLWGDAVDKDELAGLQPSDWDWLATQVEENDMLEMPDTGPFRHLTDFFKKHFDYDEARDINNLRGQIGDQFISELDIDRKLEGLRSKKSTMSDIRDFVREDIGRPKEVTVRDLARMMTPAIKPVMLERRDRMDKIHKEEAEFRKKTDATLVRRLAAFPKLNQIAVGIDRREVPGLGYSAPKVDSARGFIEQLVLPVMLKAEHETDMAEKLLGRKPEDLPRDELERITKETSGVMSLRRSFWESRLEAALPSLDRFADLQARLADLDQKGGIGNAKREVWLEIENQAGEIGRALDDLRLLATLMRDKHGVDHPDLAAMADALDAAAERMEKGIAPYRDLTGRMGGAENRRMLVHLPSLNAFAHQVNRQESDRPAPLVQSPTGLVVTQVTLARAGLEPKSDRALQAWVQDQAPLLDRFGAFALKAEDPAARSGLARERTALAKELVTFTGELVKLRQSLDPKDLPALQGMLEALDKAALEMRSALDDDRFVGTGPMSPFPATGQGSLVRPPTVFLDGLRVARSLERGNDAMQRDTDTAIDLINDFGTFDRGFMTLRARQPLPGDGDRVAVGRLDHQAEQLRSRQDGLDRAVKHLDKLIDTLDSGMMPIDDSHVPGSDKLDEQRRASLGQLRDTRQALVEQRERIGQRLDDYAHYRRDVDPLASVMAMTSDLAGSLVPGKAPESGFETLVGTTLGRGLVGMGKETAGLVGEVGRALAAFDLLAELEQDVLPQIARGVTPTHQNLLQLGHEREALADGRAALARLVDGLKQAAGKTDNEDARAALETFLTAALANLDDRLVTLDRQVNGIDFSRVL